jgi:hypothetical protein
MPPPQKKKKKKKKKITFETTRVTQQKNIMGIKNINVLVSENEILYTLSHISLTSVNLMHNAPIE